MAITDYRDFFLLAGNPSHDDDGLRGLSVQLLESPAGAQESIGRKLGDGATASLADLLRRVEVRELTADELIDLGAALADLILPGEIRGQLVQSLGGLTTNQGLRIRLSLDPGLDDLPWEYLWVGRQRSQRDATGFLALDPRISIVREAPAAGQLPSTDGPRERRVVAALANPAITGVAPLNLAGERLNLETAFRDVPGMSVEFLEQPTADLLAEMLIDGADVFHFAGHGGPGTLAFVGEGGRPTRVPAETLAVNLQARHVQLAILSACESGVAGPREPWSGVATSLVGAGVPVVLAMQYRIGDRSAVAFGRALYKALAAGRSIDEAVAVGRLGIYNEMAGAGSSDSRSRLYRDWGVPVLYLRPDAVVDLASMPDEASRQALAANVDGTIRVRTGIVKASGEVVGLEAKEILGRSAVVVVDTGDVEGLVIGVKATTVRGGTLEVDVTTKDVEAGGKVVGAQVDSIGGRRATKKRKDQ